MTFGKALRRYRKKKGWTQTQLAHILKVSDSIVSEWERNEKVPTQQLILESLRDALGKEIPEVRKLTGVRLTESVGEREDPIAEVFWRAQIVANEHPKRLIIEHGKGEIVLRLKVR